MKDEEGEGKKNEENKIAPRGIKFHTIRQNRMK